MTRQEQHQIERLKQENARLLERLNTRESKPTRAITTQAGELSEAQAVAIRMQYAVIINRWLIDKVQPYFHCASEVLAHVALMFGLMVNVRREGELKAALKDKGPQLADKYARLLEAHQNMGQDNDPEEALQSISGSVHSVIENIRLFRSGALSLEEIQRFAKTNGTAFIKDMSEHMEQHMNSGSFHGAKKNTDLDFLCALAQPLKEQGLTWEQIAEQISDFLEQEGILCALWESWSRNGLQATNLQRNYNRRVSRAGHNMQCPSALDNESV